MNQQFWDAVERQQKAIESTVVEGDAADSKMAKFLMLSMKYRRVPGEVSVTDKNVVVHSGGVDFLFPRDLPEKDKAMELVHNSGLFK